LDGINIKDYDYDEYIRLFAPVFQDFKLFAFSARENVISQEGVQGEEKDIKEVVKLCGIDEKLETLPRGIDTAVFKVYEEDGIELSGGEQQKLAIARAVYRNSPVMILDEPTAALDPMAEYEVYKNFHQIVGGKTAIYISHRLSSCRFCDKIAVFSNGTITEYGTHDELCKLSGGLYGSMWAAQAKYYQ
jgi:ABC-type multidrug transport system fused ATPase/permease subunit